MDITQKYVALGRLSNVRRHLGRSIRLPLRHAARPYHALDRRGPRETDLPRQCSGAVPRAFPDRQGERTVVESDVVVLWAGLA